MAVFRELWGRLYVKFLFYYPEKERPCVEARCLAYYAWKSVQGSRLSCRTWKNPKTNPKHFDVEFRAYEKRNPLRDRDKILYVSTVVIQDLITCATFGYGRFRGLGVASGRIPIDLRRYPYNTLALTLSCDMNENSLTHFNQ